MERALLFLLPIGIIFITVTAIQQENYLRLAIAAVMVFAFIDVKKRLEQKETNQKVEADDNQG